MKSSKKHLTALFLALFSSSISSMSLAASQSKVAVETSAGEEENCSTSGQAEMSTAVEETHSTQQADEPTEIEKKQKSGTEVQSATVKGLVTAGNFIALALMQKCLMKSTPGTRPRFPLGSSGAAAAKVWQQQHQPRPSLSK